LVHAEEAPGKKSHGLCRARFANPEQWTQVNRKPPHALLEHGSLADAFGHVGASYDVTIADTGCGIPDELQPRIFDRFFRVDKARAGANGLSGAGLGLAIARVIAELHEGRVTLQQSGAAGSTFRICLPIRE